MKMIDKYSWTDRFRKGVGSVVLGASLLLGATALEAKGSLKFDLKACRAGDNGYHTVTIPDPHPGHPDYTLYKCDHDAYQKGNLKQWAELDMVPYRFTVDNATDKNQTFTIVVGGEHYNGETYGWDYVSELSLETHADWSDANCSLVERLQAHDVSYTDGNTHIARRVEVLNIPGYTKCTANFNMRLAIGSSLYSHGSELNAEFRVHDENDVQVGHQTLPIPVAKPATLVKTMTANQAGSNSWTVLKSAPSDVVFGDTCAQENELVEKSVEITVSWTKTPGTGAEGTVDVETTITAHNAARRKINIAVEDKLYSGYGTDATLLRTISATECTKELDVSELGQVVCKHKFTISEAEAVDLNDKAVATYSDLDYPDLVSKGTVEAIASVSDIDTGSGTNESATIRDEERITGNDFSYSAEDPAIGLFVGYTEGEERNQTSADIVWSSGSQSGTKDVTFKKTVYVKRGVSATATLSDTASLVGSDGFNADDYSLDISLSADPLVELKITKIVEQDIIDQGQAVDFEFLITDPFGNDKTEIITVPAGSSSEFITISGKLPHGLYNIKEIEKIGYEATDGTTRTKPLGNGICDAAVTFTNKLADEHIAVKAGKITFPATIGSEDQSVGWTMKLFEEAEAGTWVEIASQDTTGAGEWVTLADETDLTVGKNYKIEETMKSGWYNVAKDSDCTFTYETPNRSDYECTYANAKEGKIIIRKETDGDTTTKFGFTQTIDDTTLELSGGESKTYDEKLRAGTYQITENDPGEGFALSSITCIESSYNSVTNTQLRTATIQLDPGETVECTFRNIELKDEPSIVMEKLTNGEDADDAPGPNVLVGDTITWEYIVTNNGNVKLNNIVVTDDKETGISCPSTTLEVGESMICTHTGIAVVGQYGNVGTVTSDKDDANDTSHYLGYNEDEIPDDKECPCNDVESDSSSALNTITSALMILMTLMLGLFFVRREELNTNER